MAITYEVTTDDEKLQAADLMLKTEALDSALADIQTKRATAEVRWQAEEQELQAEKNQITEEIRKLQTATLV